MSGAVAPAEKPLRPPDVVMRLARLGAAHQTRLSFLRALLRRAAAEHWRFDRPRFDLDEKGVGTAVYRVRTAAHTYSLVAFGHDLPPELRTDRVIAEAWDATFALVDGEADDALIADLFRNVPRQEAGRYDERVLVLARANRSVRLFEHVVAALAAGRQPDAKLIEAVGYLMRTTAVYGNGKFGIADRDDYAGRPELAGPFRAEMLAVYLIRVFTLDLAEAMARHRASGRAAALDPSLKRRLGIGNATGLGMAPFLVRHPTLVDRWFSARERALARVRAVPSAPPAARTVFLDRLARARRDLGQWLTDDAVLAPRIAALAGDLAKLEAAAPSLLENPEPWDGIYCFAGENLSLEAQEMAVSLVMEPNGAIVDDLADAMAADEKATFPIDGRRTTGALQKALGRNYAWALDLDFTRPEAISRFWYVSEEKLEPRLGDRAKEPGVEREQPLAIARDIQALCRSLGACPPETSVAAFLLAHPENRLACRRAQLALSRPYMEIRDNLIGAELRAVDILRAKLAFFGATRFDPRSDKWLRITLFQGAPLPGELGQRDWDDWIWGPPMEGA